MHSSGSMIRIRSNSWMQSTGHTSTHDRSFMSMQGWAMMYVTRASLARPDHELRDKLRRPFDECRLHDDLVESGRVGTLKARFVRVVRVAEDRDLGPRIDNLVG